MRKLVVLASWAGLAAGVMAAELSEVKVVDTAEGARLMVNGQTVRPRFFYGSPTCLLNIAGPKPTWFVLPFKAVEATDQAEVDFEVYPSEGPIDWLNAELVDVTAATTNRLMASERTRHFALRGISLVRDHVYRVRLQTRADHVRTYFTYKAQYRAADGELKRLPFPYGDTLGETTRLAAAAGVDFITFSTDSSWGCDDWWNEAGDERGYARIDAIMDHLISVNTNAMLMPRVIGNAPNWFLQRHPEAKMKFHRGFTIDMSSVSYRPYREQVCQQLEKLTRHLTEKYPRNFAGLHVGGQNSAEWYYMMSMTEDRSGYDVGSRDAFREYLKAKGAADWATAEVPTAEDRMTERPNGGILDPAKREDARLLDYMDFRAMEIATLLKSMGEAIKRGSNGSKLAVFFYGYSFELGAPDSGAGETGHFAVDWLTKHARGVIDGFSGPVSYRDRGPVGSVSTLSAAETINRRGYLWINEVDERTHRLDIWEMAHLKSFKPNDDAWQTWQTLKRNAISTILRGYGDWWMDLFGQGWYQDKTMWDVRRELNGLDDAMLKRSSPYVPEVAIVVDEPSLICNGWLASTWQWPLLDVRGAIWSGTTYGLYLLADLVENPPPVKLVYLVGCKSLTAEMQAKLQAVKAAHPEIAFVDDPTPSDLESAAIAERVKAAGGRVYTAPGKAYVEAAEGYVMVASREAGPLEVDFGDGARRTYEFAAGEVRLFEVEKEKIEGWKLFDRRLGMFIHWGIYSVAGWHEQEQWRLGIPRKEYERHMQEFRAEKFDPDHFIDVAESAGAEYIVITTKHHDGFCMWATETTDYNVMNTPAKRDLIGELAAACRRRGMKLGFYYSNPDWNAPFANNARSSHQIPLEAGDQPDLERLIDYQRAQIRELLTRYGEICCFFWDIRTRIERPEMNEYVRSLQSGIMINNRGWRDDGEDFDYSTPERSEGEDITFRKFAEACDSTGVHSWGYRINEDYRTKGYLTRSIDRFLAAGCNFLLNVGPKSDGTIPEESVKAMAAVGEWYAKVRESYRGVETAHGLMDRKLGDVTRRGRSVYLHLNNGLNATGFVAKYWTAKPKRVTLLNNGKEYPHLVEVTPWEFFHGRNAALHILNLPADDLANECPVLRLDF